MRNAILGNDLKPDLVHITSCRNDISIEHTASAVFIAFFGYERTNFYGLVCTVFTNFQYTKLKFCSQLGLRFIRKIF